MPQRRRFFSGFLLLLATGLTGFGLSSCEPDSDSVVDPLSSPPLVLSSSVSPSAVNTDTMNVGPERLPTDLLAIPIHIRMKISFPGPTPDVRFAVYRERADLPLAEGLLSDAGTPPDSAAGDSVFSATANVQILRSEVGILTVELTAASQGLESIARLHTVAIRRLNRPPVLSDLLAPDTVRPALQQSFLMTVRAVDPDGQADIKSVTRRTPSNLVLNLNDAGLNGDAVAGDGVFSETISLNPPPAPGPYAFTFQATDRSNASSNLIVHTVTVVQ